MTCGKPLRWEGIVPLPAAPLAFPPGAGGGATRFLHLPSPRQPLCVWLPIHRYWRDVFCWRLQILLASAPSIGEAETRANRLCYSLARWAEGKQQAIAPQKSSVTLFTSDTHQFWLHQYKSETRWPRWIEPIKSGRHVGHTLHLWPSSPRLCQASCEGFLLMKALAGPSWWFTTETLVANYKV